MKKQVTQALLFALLLALPTAGVAAEKKDKQQEAAALLARAVEVSNIRCAGCPPFRLRARVRLTGLVEGPLEGSYLLVWIDPNKWHESITFPGFVQSIIGGNGKVWRERNVDYQPLRLFQLVQTLNFRSRLRPDPERKVEKTRDRQLSGVRARCAEMRIRGEMASEFCFESASGVLLREEDWNISYEYADYSAWENKLFPRTLRALEGGKLVVEFRVEELSPERSPDPSLFVVPSGAEAWDWCEDPEPPKRVQYAEPNYPEAARRAWVSGTVWIYAVISIDGVVRDAKVIQSAGPLLDESALVAVRRWLYRPATCAGVPVPTETIVTVTYKIYRP